MKPDFQTYRQEQEALLKEQEVLRPDERFVAEEVATFMRVPVDEFHVLAAHADLVPTEVEGEHFYRKSDVERFLVNAGVIEGETAW